MNAQSGSKLPGLVTFAMLAGSALLACGPAGSDSADYSRSQGGGEDMPAAEAPTTPGGNSSRSADAGVETIPAAPGDGAEGSTIGEIGPMGSIMPYGASGSDGPAVESECAAPAGWKACMLAPRTPDSDGRMSLRGDSMSCTASQNDFWMLQMACSLMSAYGVPCTSSLVDQVASYQGRVGSTLESSDFQAISSALSQLSPGPCLTTGGINVPGSELTSMLPNGTIVVGNWSKKKVYSWVLATSLGDAKAARRTFVAANYSSFILQLSFPVYVVFAAP